MRMKQCARLVLCVMATILMAPPASAQTKIDYYFPAQVQGPIAREMESMVKTFNDMQDEVEVVPVYTGRYSDTMLKARAAFEAGKPPAAAIMSANLILEFVLEDQIEPIDNFLSEHDIDKAEYLSDFWPALLPNATLNGKLYGIPFQNSTPILYINADHFREVGLDPNDPPKTWDELIEAAQKLVKKDGDTIDRYGLMVPQNYNYLNWVLQGFVMSNGGMYFNPDYPGEVYYDQPTTRGAIQFYRDLAYKYNVMPQNVTDSKNVSTSFFAGKTSMVILSTGALSFIRKNAKFEHKVAFVPGNVRNAVAIGGGSLVIFKGLEPEQRKAAWTFVTWLTAPEQLAHWSRFTGYFAPRKSAYDLPKMKEFISEHPDAEVAVKQLQYAQPWYSTYNTVAVARPLADAVQGIITGKLQIDEAVRNAQKKANALLRPYVEATAYTEKQ